MNGNLKILLVDDNPDDRALVAREMTREFPEGHLTPAADLKELGSALRRGRWDLVVTDHQLRWSDGLTVLKAVKERWPDCAVIMFTGSGNEEIAVQAMKAGLDDYVLKSPKHYARLAAAAHMALDRAMQRRRLREAESRYRALFSRVPVGLFCAAIDGRIIDANPAMVEMLGYRNRQALLEVNARRLFANARQRREWLRAIHRSSVVERFELQLRRHDGKFLWVEINARAVTDEQGRLAYCEGSAENITGRKKADSQLRDSREQLRALAAHLQSVHEEERTRLAHAMEEDLGQVLANLKLHLGLLREAITRPANVSSLDFTRQQLKTLPRMVDSLIATVRKMCTELRPALLDDLGLEAAMQWQIQEFQKRTGIRCEFESTLQNAKLDAERATTLFRIFQETLTSVVRRARATQAAVHLREEGDKLVLEIENNGNVPAGEGSQRGLLELLGMRERASMLDGKINISNRQGKGTCVDVRIPWHHPVNEDKVAAQN